MKIANSEFVFRIFFLSLIVLASSCKKDNQRNEDCDQNVIVSANAYNNQPSDPVTIQKLQIDGDCLSVTFSASGCDGNSWIVKLIDYEAIVKTNPPKRTLRLALDNKQLCDALITKTISFNIKSLQIKGTGKVTLTIAGNSILYKY